MGFRLDIRPYPYSGCHATAGPLLRSSSIIALTMKHKHIPYLIAGLLTGYFILLMCGNGFAYNETNILSVVDRAILTPAHMYKDNGIDPEGLLSTILPLHMCCWASV